MKAQGLRPGTVFARMIGRVSRLTLPETLPYVRGISGVGAGSNSAGFPKGKG